MPLPNQPSLLQEALQTPSDAFQINDTAPQLTESRKSSTASSSKPEPAQSHLSQHPTAGHVQPEAAGLDDNDSAYGDELSTYSTTLNSEVYQHVHRHGRTYHAYKEGRYTLPNDEKELDRLDLHHHLILKAMYDKLYFAPLPPDFAGRALDIATGTGIWVLDFADIHPAAEVFGNDLSPSMPEFVHPNVKFYVDDIEAEWTYSPAEQFDFIHARFLAGAIADWPRLMTQVYENTKPGGWVEFQDWNTWLYSQDGTLPQDSALNKFHQITCAGRHAQGFNMAPGPELEQWMTDAGFIDVEVRKIFLPLGHWAKDRHLKQIGMINHFQMMKAFEAICLGVLTQLPPEAGGPWELDEVQVFLTEIRQDMANKRIHGVYDFYVVWGRKPEI